VYGATSFSNTAVRRDVILGCKELLDRVHAGEDWTVKQRAISLGLKAVTVKEKLAYHDKDHFKGSFKAEVRWGQSYRLKFGLRRALSLGYQSFFKYPMVEWLMFSRTKRLSISLLVFFILLGLCGFLGVMSGARSRYYPNIR